MEQDGIKKAPENHICAIFVTYKPTKNLLERAIKALLSQVDGIVIVDNSTNDDEQYVINNINENITHRICIGMNKGIGFAQNKGIKWAQDNGYSHVIFMDQDSVPEKDMVQHLLEATSKLENMGKKVAVVGPLVRHAGTGRSESILVRTGNLIKRVKFKKSDGIARVENIISSGSLISLKTFDLVGYLDESLFIDLIDTEWCYRAQFKGYESYLVCRAGLNHHLGETEIIDFFNSNSRIVVRHTPERYYYQYRNAVLLFKKKYIPSCWKIYQIFRQLVPRFVFQALFLSPKKKNVTQMTLGIWHGIINVTGSQVV